MKKSIALCLLLAAVCFSGCSLFGNGSEESQQPETIVVKETVYVAETPISQPETVPETVGEQEKQTNAEEATEKKGYTTADILKKANEVAENEYWIVYFDGGLHMASFNALEGFTLTWKKRDGELVCDKQVGTSIVHKWSSEDSTFKNDGGRTDIAFHCDEIVGSNCDIYDEKNDTVIKAKTE